MVRRCTASPYVNAQPAQYTRTLRLPGQAEDPEGGRQMYQRRAATGPVGCM